MGLFVLESPEPSIEKNSAAASARFRSWLYRNEGLAQAAKNFCKLIINNCAGSIQAQSNRYPTIIEQKSKHALVCLLDEPDVLIDGFKREPPGRRANRQDRLEKDAAGVSPIKDGDYFSGSLGRENRIRPARK